ncbi:hypothetical protein BH24PSE1_BH24PSE1_06060 [soil metagenome]
MQFRLRVSNVARRVLGSYSRAMTKKNVDVLAIGNAIVDVIADSSDAFLERHGMTKGSMRLVDSQEAERLYADMGPGRELSG